MHPSLSALVAHLPPHPSPSSPLRYLNDNQLSGSLPASWGGPGAFPQLSLLRLDDNRLTGGLPASWGSLPNLLVL